MKKYLLPEKGNFYKANLHSHSTVSDGEKTPEEAKAEYLEKGYSVYAYTDHNTLVTHNELTDENFLALNGVEIDINDPLKPPMKYCHIGFIALNPEITDYSFDLDRTYSGENISRMMKEGRDSGFFVIYNHPSWNEEDKDEFLHYHGMHAMEIINGNGIFGGYPEFDDKEYDQILRNGERIFCVACDDNHGVFDRFKGFTMIKAEKLDYESIAKALLEGNFYASMGPEIKALWIEDGKLHVECSDAICIRASTGTHRRYFKWNDVEGADVLNEAEFEIRPEDKYVRVYVTDKQGKYAFSNAYFLDELL